jgi:hypothetical protein
VRLLSIDHISGGGRKERKRIKQGTFYRHVLKHPEDYQALCENCNWHKYIEKERFVMSELVWAEP